MIWFEMPAIGWLLSLLIGGAAVLHAILRQQDERKAAYWIVLIVVLPIAGACLYLLFGINLIRRQARDFRRGALPLYREMAPPIDSEPAASRDLSSALDRISRFTFTTGNAVEIYAEGDAAMEAMLKSIRGANTSVTLASYIFDSRGIGAEFVDALSAAMQRGVQVRVLVDGAGLRYSWPPVTGALKRAGVPFRRFMPSHFFARLVTLNMRNHRKLLVIDGHTAFTGGMNIREGNMISRNPKHPVRDMHFRFEGPVAAQVQRVFAEDWAFCCGEQLEGPVWFPEISDKGHVDAIGIVDGPDEDIEVMPVALFAALSSARRSVRVITPYFLPTGMLRAALRLCAIRDIPVSIITPAVNNIPLVQWASQTLYPELLGAGCTIHESPAPFDHSKLVIIDDEWSFVGSTNWDPRSLRLNFEFNIAARDPDFAGKLREIFDKKQAESRKVLLKDVQNLPRSIRLRNGIARLFKPLL
jgi:cardiolipin synthase